MTIENVSLNSPFFSPTSVGLTSNDDTWKTPKDFFDKCDKEFGFTLDAAALSTSNLCEEWYGPDHPDANRRDALTRSWHKDCGDGAVWLNPPYGRTIKTWMHKAVEESRQGATVVCLVPARTDTNWFHDFCMPHEVRYLRGRLKFNNGKKDAPFASALVVMSGSK